MIPIATVWNCKVLLTGSGRLFQGRIVIYDSKCGNWLFNANISSGRQASGWHSRWWHSRWHSGWPQRIFVLKLPIFSWSSLEPITLLPLRQFFPWERVDLESNAIHVKRKRWMVDPNGCTSTSYTYPQKIAKDYPRSRQRIRTSVSQSQLWCLLSDFVPPKSTKTETGLKWIWHNTHRLLDWKFTAKPSFESIPLLRAAGT